MILREFYETLPTGYQDIDSDNSKPTWGETRKTKLTLGMISKMRQMASVQAYERANDLKLIRSQYQPASSGSAL